MNHCNIFMLEAINQAKQTSIDVPVGAVIVHNNKIIAKAHNLKEKSNDITAHAEILAIKIAAKKLNNWHLDGCDLYVTLEPCPMCGWAIFQSHIENIYFGSYDSKYGAFSSVKLEKFSNYKTNIYGGILEKECDKILNDFFCNIRGNSQI